MPLYYFDVQDSGPQMDETGTECSDDEGARRAAMELLPNIAREELPDGNRRAFSVIVRNEQKRAVFSVALSVIGLDLRPRAS